MRFKNHCDDTTQNKGCVRGNFEYLEKTEAIAPGEYDVLKKIFAEDKEALSKIEKALTEIKKLKPSAKSSNKNNKGEFSFSFFFFL